MAAKRRPRKVEMALRLDDFIILRSAARLGRQTLLSQLNTLKSTMQEKIEMVELTNDVLARLDVQIAKVEAAYDLKIPRLTDIDVAPEEGQP